MILLGTGNGEDVVLIALLLALFLLLVLLIQSKLCFKILAKINKIIIPTMLHKDLSRLKMFDKLVIAYRYWVTKNSL